MRSMIFTVAIGRWMAGACALFVTTCLSPGMGRADVMLAPSTVSANVSTSIGSLPDIINQSGLSPTYTSGVTDLATYLALDPTTQNTDTGVWAGPIPGSTAELTFGTTGEVIDALVLWDRAPVGQGVEGFTLLASADASFADPTVLGNFVAAEGSGNGSVGETATAQLFTFAPNDDEFIRMDVTSIYGICCVSLSQVAFGEEASSVPEPASLALFGSALGGFGVIRRRKRKAT
jgi:hypothetical protein